MTTRIVFHEDATERVTTAWSIVADRDTTTTDVVTISLTNLGDGNITGINVYGQATNNGGFVLVADANFSEFGTYTRGSSGDPGNIPDLSSVIFHIGTEYLAGIKIELMADAETYVQISMGGYSE